MVVLVKLKNIDITWLSRFFSLYSESTNKAYYHTFEKVIWRILLVILKTKKILVWDEFQYIFLTSLVLLNWSCKLVYTELIWITLELLKRQHMYCCFLFVVQVNFLIPNSKFKLLKDRKIIPSITSILALANKKIFLRIKPFSDNSGARTPLKSLT